MARVVLPTQLASRIAARDAVEAPGATAGEVLRRLERDHPPLAGYVLDERGRLRPHVHVFLGSGRVDLAAPVAPADELTVVTAISGGSGGGLATDAGAVELLVGTRKGLCVVRGERGGPFEVAGRAFAGDVVEYARRDPRTGRVFASVTNPFFGPRVHFTDGDPLGEWRVAEGLAFPEDAGAAVDRVWAVEPGAEPGRLWAGVAPAALFTSRDDGETWELVRPLWEVPSRPKWEGGAGGLCLHSICPWPGEPGKLAVGISAAGVWRTEDGGESWQWGVEGLVPRYVPEEARGTTTSFCVHKLRRAPLRPERVWMQFHGGVYRSDDAGATWRSIAEGLPSDFGFPLAADPRDPDRAWVIPLVADVDRVTPEGRVRVYETRDGGASWQPRGEGLPQRDAYLTVLRQAFEHDGRDPLGLYFGAESGDLFASADAGSTWTVAAERLPAILSVTVG
ncbi:MAG TPA: exo-alpha-sialidase [Thermoanaerobaculia bacterium]|nr:exo-alpha-sialidase [Thermoanaerobaculia bacterium]